VTVAVLVAVAVTVTVGVWLGMGTPSIEVHEDKSLQLVPVSEVLVQSPMH
jgi:hypothetical protein